MMHMHHQLGTLSLSQSDMTEPSVTLDLAACHCTALRQAARQATLLYDRYLAPSGLTSGQFAILTAVATWPGGVNPSVAELARELVIDRTALTRALQPTTRDGLIQLMESAQDQRVRLVRLTASGRKRVIEASRLWMEAQQQYVQALGENQAVALRALSRLVAEADLDL
jgi:DNA-binding MarR family transcriptional regulator